MYSYCLRGKLATNVSEGRENPQEMLFSVLLPFFRNSYPVASSLNFVSSVGQVYGNASRTNSRLCRPYLGFERSQGACNGQIVRIFKFIAPKSLVVAVPRKIQVTVQPIYSTYNNNINNLPHASEHASYFYTLKLPGT